jgi:hypothetical protein
MNGVSSPGGLTVSSATSFEEGSLCLMLDPSTNPNVGSITGSFVGSIVRQKRIWFHPPIPHPPDSDMIELLLLRTELILTC